MSDAMRARFKDWQSRGAKLLPGFFLALIIAATARYLSEHNGGPVMLYALLIGMAFHFLYEEGRCREGLVATSKAVLRLGVALLGLRISFDQIAGLGLGALALVIAVVMGCLLLGLIVARILGRSSSFGLLTGGSVGICGASAAMAIASVLPENRENETDMLFTVIAVTSLSTVAMVLYPAIGAMLGLDDIQMGMMLGATIHDVAQVVGAGYAVSDEAGDAATIIKLMRVMMLLPVLVIVSLVMTRSLTKRRSKDQPSAIPWFAFAFAGLVVINSLGLVPEQPKEMLVELSRWCLIVAIAALGAMTTLKSLMALGPRHFAVVLVETLILLAAVLLAILIWF